MMEQTANQIPSWGLPFLLLLELGIFYAMTRVGRLIVTCKRALEWVGDKSVLPSFNPTKFAETIAALLDDINTPLAVVSVAFIVNIICIVSVIVNNDIAIWILGIAVIVNTNVVISFLDVRKRITEIIETVESVEILNEKRGGKDE